MAYLRPSSASSVVASVANGATRSLKTSASSSSPLPLLLLSSPLSLAAATAAEASSASSFQRVRARAQARGPQRCLSAFAAAPAAAAAAAAAAPGLEPSTASRRGAGAAVQRPRRFRAFCSSSGNSGDFFLFDQQRRRFCADGRSGPAETLQKEEAAAPSLEVSLDPPSGTRDFFPNDMRQQRWLLQKFRDVAARYNFQEFDAPVLEREELYRRKAGEEIVEQMYNFKDKDGVAVTLRPEMTPSLARMVLQLMRSETGAIAAVLPLKWFSVPQCWRFETTQRGRKREHYQWNMDLIGVRGVVAEVELLSAIVHFFESVGLTANDVGLKVNSRKLLAAVLEAAEVAPERFAAACVIIDKLDKIGADAVEQELVSQIGLKPDSAKTVVKATAAKSLEDFAAETGLQSSPEVLELQRLFELAEDYGIGPYLRFDASVVRGLAYYTGVVFEGFDKAGVLRAICGGGRYDGLLQLYGSKKEVPCVGFGFGDCVIMELLKEKNLLPSTDASVDYVVAAYSDDMVGKAMRVARELRSAGFSVDLLPESARKVKKAFKYADRLGACRIAFVAPAEWEAGLVRVKDLRVPADSDLPKQVDIPFDDLGNVDSYFKAT